MKAAADLVAFLAHLVLLIVFGFIGCIFVYGSLVQSIGSWKRRRWLRQVR